MRNFVVCVRNWKPQTHELIEENEQPCCYARSNKYWVTDPTGIAWETFPHFGRHSGLR